MRFLLTIGGAGAQKEKMCIRDSLYDILGTGMLSESKENPVCPVPPFPFAGLLLRDNGNIPNGILLQFRTWQLHSDRKSTRLNSSHLKLSRMPSSA